MFVLKIIKNGREGNTKTFGLIYTETKFGPGKGGGGVGGDSRYGMVCKLL